MSEKKNEVNYDKCYLCPHSHRYYSMGGGLYILCLLTGESSLIINNCIKNTEAEYRIAFDKELEEELTEEKECKCKSGKKKGRGKQ